MQEGSIKTENNLGVGTGGTSIGIGGTSVGIGGTRYYSKSDLVANISSSPDLRRNVVGGCGVVCIITSPAIIQTVKMRTVSQTVTPS